MSALDLVSIGIAGWGDPDTGLPYRLRIEHDGDASGTVIASPILLPHPSEISTLIDLTESWLSSSSLTCKVARIDSQPVAVSLRRFLFQSRPPPLGYIVADVNRTQTSIFFVGSPEGTAPDIDSVIYIGREALKVTAVTGVGTTKTLTVTRARFGTQQQPHSAHPLLGDRWVYGANPIVETREVTRYDYSPAANTETIRWRGILEPPRQEDGTTTIVVKARDSWANVAGRRFGEGRVEFMGRLGAVPDTQNIATGRPLLGVSIARPREIPVEQASIPALPNGDTLVLASDDAIAAAAFATSSSATAPNLVQLSDQEVVPLFVAGDSEWVEMPSTPSRIREVMIADAGDGTGAPTYSMVRDENVELSDHPLDILLNLWTSTGEATWSAGGSHTIGGNGDYDWLPGHWGLGIPVEEIDVDGILALRDGLLLGARCRSFVLGTDDDSLDAIEVTKRLLKPLFLFPTYTVDGKLSVAAVDDPGPDNTAVTLTAGDVIAPPRVGVGSQPWSTQKRIRGSRIKAGRRWPTDKYGDEWIGAGNEGARRNREPYGKSVAEIDAGDYGNPIDGSLAPRQRSLLQMFDARRLIVLRDRLPEFQLDLRAGIQTLAPGQWMELTLGVLIGEDGDRMSIDEHRCLIVEALRASDDRTQGVRVLDFYSVARANKKVLASWRIASVASDDEFTISLNEFTTADPATWVDGALVNLHDQRGVLRSTDGPQFGSISSATVVLDQQWQASGVNVTPVAGDLVLPAAYDDAVAFWPDGAWIADALHTLGGSSNTTDLARWGL